MAFPAYMAKQFLELLLISNRVEEGYIARLEKRQKLLTHMSFGKVMSFMEILSKGAPILPRLCWPPRPPSLVDNSPGCPKLTQTIWEGRITELSSIMLAAGGIMRDCGGLRHRKKLQ